jgi:hypothetical protein
MKKLFVFVIAVIVLTSCATTKTSKVVTPAGNWDYSITGTPEGDFFGALVITSQDKIFTAKMNARGNELAFNKFTWDAATKKVGGEFNYSGYTVYFDATVAGEEMAGTMSAEDATFPFKATRKK